MKWIMVLFFFLVKKRERKKKRGMKGMKRKLRKEIEEKKTKEYEKGGGMGCRRTLIARRQWRVSYLGPARSYPFSFLICIKK